MKKMMAFFTLLCVVSVLVIGLSLNAYAQTSNPIRFNDDNDILTITIKNVAVMQQNNVPYVTMDVYLQMQNLGQTYVTFFYKDSITLVDEQGVEYHRTADCPGLNIMQIRGDNNGEANFPDCFNVDKRFNNYSIHYYDSYSRKSIVIGNIDLTQISNGQVTSQSTNPSDSNPSTSSQSNSNPSSSGTSQSITNIFEQFMNFLKQIFSQASKSTQTLTSSDKLTTTQNNVYTEDNYYAQLVPSNIQVVDKGRYNVLSFTVDVNIQDLPFDGNVNFEDLYTTLQDENSKIYHPDKAECALNDLISIIGKQSASARYTVCYSVDKTSNKFSIWYTEPPNNYHSYRIGYLSVDSDLFSKYQSHYSSQPIQIGTIDLGK